MSLFAAINAALCPVRQQALACGRSLPNSNSFPPRLTSAPLSLPPSLNCPFRCFPQLNSSLWLLLPEQCDPDSVGLTRCNSFSVKPAFLHGMSFWKKSPLVGKVRCGSINTASKSKVISLLFTLPRHSVQQLGSTFPLAAAKRKLPYCTVCLVEKKKSHPKTYSRMISQRCDRATWGVFAAHARVRYTWTDSNKPQNNLHV